MIWLQWEFDDNDIVLLNLLLVKRWRQPLEGHRVIVG